MHVHVHLLLYSKYNFIDNDYNLFSDKHVSASEFLYFLVEPTDKILFGKNAGKINRQIKKTSLARRALNTKQPNTETSCTFKTYKVINIIHTINLQFILTWIYPFLKRC